MFSVEKLAHTAYISTLHRYTHMTNKMVKAQGGSAVFQTHTHTKTFSHTDTQGSTRTEKEMDLEARYRHTKRKRLALKQEETCTQVTCTHPEQARQRDSYRKKDKQMWKDTSTHKNRTCTRSQGKQSEHVAPIQFPFSPLIGKGADRTFLMNLQEICVFQQHEAIVRRH